MMWWWMPFMALFDTPEAERLNTEASTDEKEARGRARANTKRKAVKNKRKSARRTPGRKSSTRKGASERRAKRRQAA